jgi:peroxiredoxin
MLYKEVRDALAPKYAENPYVKHLTERLKGVLAPGMEAPEIAMSDPEGVTRRLSDLRGKVVLIDFWASWCSPCRRENPNVVKLYNKYKDQGFEIFSVSLDKDGNAWRKAIKDDGLAWPNHVSDLKQWQSAAGRTYGIMSIPATVLVDREGKIIARNLRGAELEKQLQEIFK